jgi:hypothetical protein
MDDEPKVQLPLRLPPAGLICLIYISTALVLLVVSVTR